MDRHGVRNKKLAKANSPCQALVLARANMPMQGSTCEGVVGLIFCGTFDPDAEWQVLLKDVLAFGPLPTLIRSTPMYMYLDRAEPYKA